MCEPGCIADILAHLAFFLAAAGVSLAHLAIMAFSAAVMGFVGDILSPDAIIWSPLDMASPDFIWANDGVAAASRATASVALRIMAISVSTSRVSAPCRNSYAGDWQSVTQLTVSATVLTAVLAHLLANVQGRLDTLPHPAHMELMLIETETTPNPATLKFLPGRTVMDMGTRDFATPEEAASSPLAETLFGLGDVTGVFFGHAFVSVTAAPGVDWTHLKADVLNVLLDHFSANMPLFKPASAAGISVPVDSGFTDNPADADIIDQIKDLIETRVRPAVASDGGDIVYRGFVEGKVYLQLQGACSGCPSSSATLKNGIESLLKYYVPEVTEVLAV